MSSSLDEVKRKLAEEKARKEQALAFQQQANAVVKDRTFTLETVRALWLAYADSLDRKFSQVVLRGCSLTVSGSEIVVGLDSTLHQTEFAGIQSDLRAYLVAQLQNNQFTLRTELREAPKAEEGARLYTQQDKFNFLQTRYPALNVLKQHLGLDW